MTVDEQLHAILLEMASEQVKVGDIVITAIDKFALLVAFSKGGRAVLQFVNNGPYHYRQPQTLRRATLAQIARSPLSGVDCNQAMEAVNG